MSTKATPASWTIATSLIVSLVVAAVAAWLGAENARTETLRAARRSAYSDYLGSVNECQLHFSIFGPIDQIFDTAEPQGGAEHVRRELREVRPCAVSLASNLAKVRLVADGDAITEAASDLHDATLQLAVAAVMPTAEKDQKSMMRYLWAVGSFETLARQSVGLDRLTARWANLMRFASLLHGAVVIYVMVVLSRGVSRDVAERFPSWFWRRPRSPN